MMAVSTIVMNNSQEHVKSKSTYFLHFFQLEKLWGMIHISLNDPNNTLVDNKVQGRLFTMNVKKCLKRQLLVVSNFERSPELLLEIKKNCYLSFYYNCFK